MQGWGDSPLTPLGQEQAFKHGVVLNRERVEEIHASDLGRVKETISCIRKNCDVSPCYYESLREFNMGAWEGELVEAIEEHSPTRYAEWRRGEGEIAVPDGESKSEVKKRVTPTLDAALSGDATRIAFVTHGGTTRVLLELLVPMNEDQKREIRIPNSVIHLVERTTEFVSVCHFRDGGEAIDGVCTSWT